MKAFGLAVVLGVYTLYIMNISMQHPQLDYLQKTMYQIMKDSYFIGCKSASGDTAVCKASATKYGLDLEKGIGSIL